LVVEEGSVVGSIGESILGEDSIGGSIVGEEGIGGSRYDELMVGGGGGGCELVKVDEDDTSGN
jgi:hypothetical protein